MGHNGERQKCYYNIWMIMGACFVMSGFFMAILFLKVTFGMILLIGLGISALIWGKLDSLYRKNKQNRKIKYIRHGMLFLFLFWFMSFLVVEGLILTAVDPDHDVEVDYVVVLGAGLRGEIPSLTLHTRLEKGLWYLRQNPDLQVVVSGGQGPGETITEAEAMKRYFIRQGIDDKRIILEDLSTSTMENLTFSKEVLNEKIGNAHEKIKIMIITSDFHMYRSKYLAKSVGFIPYGMPSKTPLYLWVDYSIREYFAIIKSYIFD